MNSVKLLHIKCCFFQFLNGPVALKNIKKILPPQEKVEMTPLCTYMANGNMKRPNSYIGRDICLHDSQFTKEGEGEIRDGRKFL